MISMRLNALIRRPRLPESSSPQWSLAQQRRPLMHPARSRQFTHLTEYFDSVKEEFSSACGPCSDFATLSVSRIGVPAPDIQCPAG